MPDYCEIIEVAHTADAVGYPCGKDGLGECSDCGTRVCDEHADKCAVCVELFCLACLSFHEAAHVKKPAFAHSDEQPSRRRA
jgi:hypothetical protein